MLYHIREGRKSGFSWCCVFWYLLTRNIIRPLFRVYVNCTATDRAEWTSHVLCPRCAHRYSKTLAMATYYDCAHCGWRQFQNSVCCKCKGMGEVHSCNKTLPLPGTANFSPLKRLYKGKLFTIYRDK